MTAEPSIAVRVLPGRAWRSPSRGWAPLRWAALAVRHRREEHQCRRRGRSDVGAQRCRRDRYGSETVQGTVIIGMEVAHIHVRQLVLQLTRQDEALLGPCGVGLRARPSGVGQC